VKDGITPCVRIGIGSQKSDMGDPQSRSITRSKSMRYACSALPANLPTLRQGKHHGCKHRPDPKVLLSLRSQLLPPECHTEFLSRRHHRRQSDPK